MLLYIIQQIDVFNLVGNLVEYSGHILFHNKPPQNFVAWCNNNHLYCSWTCNFGRGWRRPHSVWDLGWRLDSLGPTNIFLPCGLFTWHSGASCEATYRPHGSQTYCIIDHDYETRAKLTRPVMNWLGNPRAILQSHCIGQRNHLEQPLFKGRVIRCQFSKGRLVRICYPP